MTAGALEQDREECLAAGMDDYLGKPMQIEDLRVALERAAREVPLRPNPAKTALHTLDWAVLDSLRAMDDSDGSVAADLIRMYLEQVPASLEAASEALNGNDASGFASALHRLRGSSSMVGAAQLAHLCEELERGARVDGLTSASGPALQAAREEFERVRDELVNSAHLRQPPPPGARTQNPP